MPMNRWCRSGSSNGGESDGDGDGDGEGVDDEKNEDDGRSAIAYNDMMMMAIQMITMANRFDDGSLYYLEIIDSDGLNGTAMTITCSCDDMPMLVWHGDDDRTLLRQWANDSGDSDVDVAIWRW